jgi:hypothetical protein
MPDDKPHKDDSEKTSIHISETKEPYSPEEAKRAMDVLIELRFEKAIHRIQENHINLDQLVSDAQEHDCELPYQVLYGLRAALSYIKDNYEKVRDSYEKYENLEISLEEYSAILSDIILRIVDKTASLSKVYEYTQEERAAVEEEKKKFYDRLLGQLLDIDRLVDEEINVRDLFVYISSAKVLNEVKDEGLVAKGKIEDIYPDLKECPAVYKRGLERKAGELCLLTPNVRSNEKVVDIVKKAVEELGFVYHPRVFDCLRKQARELDIAERSINK